MSGKLGYRDAEGLTANPSCNLRKSSNAMVSLILDVCDGAQEGTDGDDSGYTRKCSGEDESIKFCDEISVSSPENLSPKSSVEDEDYEIAMQRIFSDPTPVKLISAMKGSRERCGLTPRKLRVSWAPDVYDPPPSIVSHTRGKRQPKLRNKDNHKKNGKKGQKSKSSRGTSSRDKKQLRRNAYEKLRNSYELSGADTHCGDNLITSLAKVHQPVAEAL